MYLLESPRQGDSNKYTKRMFSWGIKWEYRWKNRRSADFCPDQIDVITKFAVITNVVIKRVHCICSIFGDFQFKHTRCRHMAWQVCVDIAVSVLVLLIDFKNLAILTHYYQTFKAPITTAAEGSLECFFIVFWENKTWYFIWMIY